MAGGQSVAQVLQRMADRHAPDEARDLPLIMRRCLAEPALMYPSGQSDTPLGAGVADAAVVVVPILMGVLNDLAEDGLKSGLVAMWRRRKNRRRAFDPETVVREFTPEMIALVQATLLSRLLCKGRGAAEAKAIADDFAAELDGPR